MNESERAGPIVWTGIIAATCVLLLVVNKLLWLALPFIFGTVLHYILLGPMQRMVRAGFGRNAAAMWVCLLFFSFASLALAAILSWSRAAFSATWPCSTTRRATPRRAPSNPAKWRCSSAPTSSA